MQSLSCEGILKLYFIKFSKTAIFKLYVNGIQIAVFYVFKFFQVHPDLVPAHVIETGNVRVVEVTTRVIAGGEVQVQVPTNTGKNKLAHFDSDRC